MLTLVAVDTGRHTLPGTEVSIWRKTAAPGTSKASAIFPFHSSSAKFTGVPELRYRRRGPTSRPTERTAPPLPPCSIAPSCAAASRPVSLHHAAPPRPPTPMSSPPPTSRISRRGAPTEEDDGGGRREKEVRRGRRAAVAGQRHGRQEREQGEGRHGRRSMEEGHRPASPQHQASPASPRSSAVRALVPVRRRRPRAESRLRIVAGRA